MEKAFLTFFIVFYFFCVGFSNARNYYTAAVVEYSPVKNASLTPDQRLESNVDEYLKLLGTVSSKELDVAVFPESTLASGAAITSVNDLIKYTTQVPSPKDAVNPCERRASYPKFFSKLSCAARDFKTYMVVNLKERSNCTKESQEAVGDKRPCARHGYNLYNTDVVFDRKGVVVARYRKFNLFGEFHFNTTLKAEVINFTTDFGVNFGLFTCFDLQFDQPALELVRRGVKNVIFPTMWFSELPFLTALQAQQMYALGNQVNFLSAGANNPKIGSGGTGIFQAGKPIVYDYVSKGGSQIYVANISLAGILSENESHAQLKTTDDDNDRLAEEMDGFYLKRDEIDVYTHKYLNTSSPANELNERLCHNNANFTLCCEFHVKYSRNDSNPGKLKNRYEYFMVSYSGVRSYTGMYNGGVEHCGIIACLNKTLQSCARRFPKHSEIFWPIVFNKLTIRANYSDVLHKDQTPTSLLSSIRPIDPSATTWSSLKFPAVALIERRFSLSVPQNRLLTFGIHGRDFSRDSDPFVNGSKRHGLALISVLLCALVRFYIA